MQKKTVFGIIGIAAILLFILFIFNFKIGIVSKGNIIKYGEASEEHLADVKLVGKVFFKNGFKLGEKHVKIANNIDTTKVGEYTVDYNASYMFWKANAKMTYLVVDTQVPSIKLEGDSTIKIPYGTDYEEAGYSAFDDYDGDLTDKVQVIKEAGTIVYKVKDNSGNEAVAFRSIIFLDTTAPVLQLEGSSSVVVKKGDTYKDPGFSARDDIDGDVTKNTLIDTTGVDFNKAGTYTVKYSVTDRAGNETTAERTVIVRDGSTTSDKVIYLTFDDGPGPYTNKLLDVLDKYDVKVTFYVCNKPNYFDALKRAAKSGHTIAVHSYTHDYPTIYKSVDAYLNDFNKMAAVIKEQTGIEVDTFRFPGGGSNAISKKYCAGIMTKLTKLMVEKGYQYYDWNVDSNDAGGAKSADEVFKNVTNGCKDRKSSVVLQHDIKEFSVDAVERIIVWGLENGFSFEPLHKDTLICHHGVNN